MALTSERKKILLFFTFAFTMFLDHKYSTTELYLPFLYPPGYFDEQGQSESGGHSGRRSLWFLSFECFSRQTQCQVRLHIVYVMTHC